MLNTHIEDRGSYRIVYAMFTIFLVWQGFFEYPNATVIGLINSFFSFWVGETSYEVAAYITYGMLGLLALSIAWFGSWFFSFIYTSYLSLATFWVLMFGLKIEFALLALLLKLSFGLGAHELTANKGIVTNASTSLPSGKRRLARDDRDDRGNERTYNDTGFEDHMLGGIVDANSSWYGVL